MVKISSTRWFPTIWPSKYFTIFFCKMIFFWKIFLKLFLRSSLVKQNVLNTGECFHVSSHHCTTTSKLESQGMLSAMRRAHKTRSDELQHAASSPLMTSWPRDLLLSSRSWPEVQGWTVLAFTLPGISTSTMGLHSDSIGRVKDTHRDLLQVKMRLSRLEYVDCVIITHINSSFPHFWCQNVQSLI